MRLRDELDACFVRREVRVELYRRLRAGVEGPPYADDAFEEVEGPRVYLPTVDTLAEAQGVMYLCPLCYKNNGGEVGTHRVLNWFAGRGVPDDADPKPGRWIPVGTDLDDLTYVGPAAASVLLTSGCGWHGFVRAGDAT